MTLAFFDRWLFAVPALLLSLFAGLVWSCRCGHVSPQSAAVIAPFALVLWLWTLHGWFVPRALLAAAPYTLLARALTDGLWDGHDALWKGAPPPEFLLVDRRLAVRLTVLALAVGGALALRWVRLQRAGGPVSIGLLLGSAPHSNQPGS